MAHGLCDRAALGLLPEERLMPAVVFPRRATSTATTISVVSASTALSAAAAAVTSNTFSAFSGGGLSTRSAHPTSGFQCDVTEDGSLSQGRTTLDWAGNGVYDPTTKRVMFSGKGIGNSNGDYIYNTQAIYNETTDSWSATRGFRASDQVGSSRPTGHQYDGNALCLISRRHYRKQFTDDSGFGSGPILQFNLDTNTWGPMIAPPSNDDASLGNGALESVEDKTGIGAGALWYLSSTNSSGSARISELNLGTNVWNQEKIATGSGSFPALTADGGNGYVMAFNPRAFGGAGGVLLGGGNTKCYTVRCDTLAVAAVADAPTIIDVRYDGKLTADPSGSGWLLFASNGFVYRFDGSTWTQRAALPENLSGGTVPFIVVPIDAHGVVWAIRDQAASPRAWLYNPRD
jgi:hypothetical protein